ncbi:MAG: hypothetical protein ABH836_03695 [Candidatus Omnitrophota bacterium]
MISEKILPQREKNMSVILKRNFSLTFILLMWCILLCSCAKYNLLKESRYPCCFAKEEMDSRIIYINKFIDNRPVEEKKGLAKKSNRILSFATKDSDFKEQIDEAITNRIQNKLMAEKVPSVLSSYETSTEGNYVLKGEIEHFQIVMKLPNTTFVPYLGTAATVITKDEFDIAVSIKAVLKNGSTGDVLFSRIFDASKDINLPTGILNLARFKRGINYRFQMLDDALEDVLKQIAQEIKNSLKNEVQL